MIIKVENAQSAEKNVSNFNVYYSAILGKWWHIYTYIFF